MVPRNSSGGTCYEKLSLLDTYISGADFRLLKYDNEFRVGEPQETRNHNE